MEELHHDGEEKMDEGLELEFGIAHGGGVYAVGGKNEVTGDRGEEEEEEGDQGDGCDDDDDDDFLRRYHLNDFRDRYSDHRFEMIDWDAEDRRRSAEVRGCVASAAVVAAAAPTDNGNEDDGGDKDEVKMMTIMSRRKMRQSMATAFRGAASYVIEEEEEEGADDKKEARSTAGVGSSKGSRIIIGGGKSIRPSAPSEKKNEKKKTKAENVGEIARARREEQRKRDIDSKRRVFRTGGLGTSPAVTSSSYSSSTTRGTGSSIMSDITSSGATVYHSAYSSGSEGGRMATAPVAAKKEMGIKVGAAATPGDNGNENTTKNAREIALVDALKTSAATTTTTDPGKSRDAVVGAAASKLPNRNTVPVQQPQQQQAVVLEQMEEGGGDDNDEELGDMTKKEIGDPLAGNDNTTNKRSKILSYKNVKYDYYDFSTGTEYEGRTAMRCCVVLFALFCVVFGCILVFFVFEYEMPEAE